MDVAREVPEGGGVMAKKIYINKIVRDGMPEVIVADGYMCKTKRLEPRSGELHAMLIAKLMEETGEYVQGDRCELADVYEVLLTLTHEMHGKDEAWLHETARVKREQRGGMSNLVLVFIEPRE